MQRVGTAPRLSNSLPLNAAQCNPSHDIFREKQVDDHNRQDRDGDHHVHLAHVELEEVRAAQLRNQDGHRLPLGVVDDQRRDKVVVPRAHKAEDGLHRHGGLEDRQDDRVEGVELAGAINARCIDNIPRQAGIHVLLHKEEHGGRGNAGQDQRPQGVGQLHLVHQIQKAQCRHLCRHRHDKQDDRERQLAQLEVVGVDGVGRQRAEIDRQRRAGRRNDEAVAQAGQDRHVGVVGGVVEVDREAAPGQRVKPLLDGKVVVRSVDNEHIEEEQADKAQHKHYILPEKTEYAYRLKGFNEDWMTTTYDKVTYTNLAPGTYMLKVKAVNSDGYGGDEEASLKIVIYPPFWRSVWAYIVYSLLVVAVLVLGCYWVLRGERNKFKIQQIKQEIERNQEKADMNLKFFTHVSHELRTPLTLIISPLETLMKEYQSDAVLMDKLNIVQRNAVRLLNLVNQLLDFRKIDVNGYYLSLSDDDIISYIHTICDSFISLSEQKDVSLTFYSAVSSLNMLFDGDKMREVMMSLLSNAFKFTCSGGRVDVSVSLVEGQDSREMLEIRVADTGIGIKKEDRERIFGHFYQVDYPDMSFSGGGGSLSIVRDFVTLHDGTVNVMDNTPVGCVFIIHIPVKRSGGKPMKIEQVQVVDKSVEDISTLQVPESYVASNVGEESKEELNHIITIEGLEEDIRRLESGNTEEIAEEKNIETISAVAPQRATVIQLVEGESNEMITHIIPPEGVQEMVTAVPEEKSELELKTVWNHAYIDLKPSGTAITSMDEKLINHAVKYVEDNIARSDLSVEELSKELGMSRVHLYKKLLAITGKTPIEFIRIIRLKRAAQLLRGSQQNISEIAYQVGFNNPKYFSRYFKEEFGILPSAFQYKQGR